MAEATEKKKSPAKRKPRPRPVQAVLFSVWSANGGPLAEAAVEKIQDAINTVQVELFNDGIRVLTQTNKG